MNILRYPPLFPTSGPCRQFTQLQNFRPQDDLSVRPFVYADTGEMIDMFGADGKARDAAVDGKQPVAGAG